MKKDIKDYTLKELREEMCSMGEKPHRAVQIFQWIYKKKVDDFSLMTDLSKKLADKLDSSFNLKELELKDLKESKDHTKKYLWRLKDDEYIESVLIKNKGRKTLCISSQVGCRIKCPFCASGQLGFKRNLSVAEIIDQIVSVEKIEKLRITNIVFMGTGEPLDNFDNVIKAIKIVNSKESLEIGARKITLSTCGILPGIIKLKDTGLQTELSVSLHATGDKLRDKLVPVNKKYPLGELIKTCREYFDSTGRVITLEYTLISGVNDSLDDAENLAGIAKRIKAKVNLISCNSFPGYEKEGVTEKKIREFRQRLVSSGVIATYRRSKGDDILAACGQLSGSQAAQKDR